MAILRVAQMGHPVLRMVAEPVPAELIGTDEFEQLCEDLLDTMDEYDGAGLAAPQVHVPLRVVVLVLDDEKGPEYLINPVITPLGDETRTSYEGCLSVEGMRGEVTRPSHVRVDALDRDGTPKAYELVGYPATVVQHECDHLDGVLYIDRVDTKTLAFMKEYRKYGPNSDYARALDGDAEDAEDAEDEVEDG
jgi:peptide deformylase